MKNGVTVMRLLDLILEIDPTFQETLDSPQYPYSKQLIKNRLESGLTQLEYAKALDVDFDHFLGLECCLLTIPLEDYQRVAEISENLKRKG